MSFGGGATNKAPPPKIYPVDIPKTFKAANDAGIYQWDLSQDKYAQQYPGIVQAQDQSIQNAYRNLTGPLDPTLQQSFVDTGLSQAMGAFGGGSESPNVTGKGSIGRNTIAADYSKEVLGYQDYNRNFIQNMINERPYPATAGSGAVTTLAGTNIANETAANQQAAGYQAAQRGADQASQQQTTTAAVGAGTALASAALTSAIAAGAISW